MSEQTATYQARLTLAPGQHEQLAGYAALYGHIERTLYADICRGKNPGKLKSEYLRRYGITARMFNAISRLLAGKISSVKELLPLRIQDTETAIKKAEKVIKKVKNPHKIHQKNRRLGILRGQLEALQAVKASGKAAICFGSKKLFRAQFALAENGYATHREWRQDWQAKRNSQFFVIGSKDETGGCQGCTATINEDGTFNLRLRLPDSHGGGYTILAGVRFSYGSDVLSQALAAGIAISYRFLLDGKGGRVFTTTELPDVKRVSVRAAGAVGADINHDCLAVSEIDRFGNLVATAVVPCQTYGKTTNQTKAAIGEAVKAVVAAAASTKKPIVIEKLEFRKKKAELEGADPRYARMLSSLAYNSITQHLKAAAYRAGIEVIEVNPAYTSTIGAVNYARRCGISVHQAAAVAIARRGLGFSETPPTSTGLVPVGNGDHVTFPLPVRNRGKHVWSYWAAIRKAQQAALAAHARSGELKNPPAPLRLNPALCSTWALSVRSRHANRQQHCSAGVMDDIPW